MRFGGQHAHGNQGERSVTPSSSATRCVRRWRGFSYEKDTPSSPTPPSTPLKIVRSSDVGVCRVAGGEQQSPRQHDARDRGARFRVRTVGRQLERVAERLVAVAAADAAGEVAPRRDHVAPSAEDRIEQLVVAELNSHVDGARVEIQLADGMTGDRRCGADRRMVLPVRGAETTLAEEPVATALEQMGREPEPALLAGDPIQLDERHLDPGWPSMPRRSLPGPSAASTWAATRVAIASNRSSPSARCQATAAWMRCPKQYSSWPHSRSV